MFLSVWCINKGLTSFFIYFCLCKKLLFEHVFRSRPSKVSQNSSKREKQIKLSFILKISSTFAVVCVC